MKLFGNTLLLQVVVVVVHVHVHFHVHAEQDGNDNDNDNDNQFLDRWNYYGTVQREDGNVDFGPPDWGDIECDEKNHLDECIAYKDKWHTGREWDIEQNYCRWCPSDLGFDNCGRHHQSPIDLKRDRGIEGHPMEKECIDVHWMKYEDSWCTLDHLMEADAFSIERFGLRVAQPITVFDNGDIRSDCLQEGRGRRFGRIDFSKGYSQWWFLSHIDFHTPSEHTQENKRYDGEIQLYHFYSVSAKEAGVANEMGTVSIFLEAYENAPPYRYLDKLLCLWRRHEYMNRQECGLQPTEAPYPGCFPYNNRRKLRETLKRRRRKQQQQQQQQQQDSRYPNFQTIHDLILYREQRLAQGTHNHSSLPKLVMDDVNWEPPQQKDWEAWIAQESHKMSQQDEQYQSLYNDQYDESQFENNETAADAAHDSFRKLLAGDELEWFNYFPMLGVRTEYYYRYSGGQTIPPCYGNFQESSRQETNHWRVMKDPIRIHPRQLKEMQRLLRERIAPRNDPINPCQPDTAARVTSDGQVEAARPTQYWHPAHFKTFCECKDWRSKWPEDRDWCEINDIYQRFYEQPYNFRTNGF